MQVDTFEAVICFLKSPWKQYSHSFIQQLFRYPCHVPGILFVPRDLEVNKVDIVLVLMS